MLQKPKHSCQSNDHQMNEYSLNLNSLNGETVCLTFWSKTRDVSGAEPALNTLKVQKYFCNFFPSERRRRGREGGRECAGQSEKEVFFSSIFYFSYPNATLRSKDAVGAQRGVTCVAASAVLPSLCVFVRLLVWCQPPHRAVSPGCEWVRLDPPPPQTKRLKRNRNFPSPRLGARRVNP